ncbi:efflux transporter outer membrane subunit [bacterium]|nr:efflux transporter outer membrane subunit [bacterium]
MKQPLLLSLMLVALTGCSVGPDFVRPGAGPDVPEDWARTPVSQDAATGPAPAARWWTAFGDAALDSLVDRAMRRNHDLAAAAARVAEARAQTGGAEAQRWPTIEVGGSASRSKSANLNIPFPINPYVSSFSASATLRWEADLWGRLGRGKESAVAGLLASENDRRALAHSLAAEVVRTWLEIGELENQLALTRESVASYTRTVAIVEDRYHAGLVEALDMHLARQNLAAAQATEPGLLQARAGARRRLEILCGDYPAGRGVQVDGAREDQACDLLPAVPEGLPSELLDRRPDLAAAESRLHAAVAQIGQAKAALYPRISLTGSAGSTSRELADLGKEGTDVFSLVGNLVMPLINRGATKAQIQAAEARAAQASAAYRQAVLTAFAEVENTLDQDHYQQERAGHLTRAARSAAFAQEISQDRYQRGLDNILVLLEAQRRFFTTESQRLSAQRDRKAARVNLILALGGPWDLPGAPPSGALVHSGANQGVEQ